jgi:hypothetical protein
MRRIILALGLIVIIPTSLYSQSIVYSTSSNRANPVSLQDATLTGQPVYIFIPPTTGLSRVVFKLDGTVVQTETTYPWDFKGGSASTANPFNVTSLQYGDHTIEADVIISGLTSTISALFHYPAPIPPPTGIINPTVVNFTCSPDHDVLIEPGYSDSGKPILTGYLAYVYSISDLTSPTRVWDLLKPNQVNGECSASIRDFILGLAESDYQLTILAVGPGGLSSESSPSEKFRRASPGPFPLSVQGTVTVK